MQICQSAVRRHCTSKLSGGLDRIATLGFRGEALPSVGSVARLSLRSRAEGNREAFEILVDHGRCEGPRPTALSRGTVVEVRDLFQKVPARLKFLKSERAESAAISVVGKHTDSARSNSIEPIMQKQIRPIRPAHGGTR